MGWFYPHGANRKSLIRELAEDREVRPGPEGTVIKTVCIAKCFRGAITHQGVLWSIWERTFTDQDGVAQRPVERYICCDLMECLSIDGMRTWGYKPLDESCGPCYYNCPEKYLKMVPVVVDAEWRASVAEYHLRRREKRAARKAVA